MAASKAEKYYRLYESDEAATAAETAMVAGVDKWTDPDFKADGSSLYKDPFHPPRGSIPPDVIDWLRINSNEIAGCNAPVTFADGTSPGDVIQGQLGDCWFVSAMSVMAAHEEYVDRNFVSDINRAKGIYTFKFFKQGQWRYVHIDDKIPCDRKGHPIYAHGKDCNETWVMILEKAYAKLHACYDNLKTGYIDYGLRDLTGGACIKFKWTDKPTAPLVESGEIFNMIMRAMAEGSLAGCSFNTSDAEGTESDRGDGILAGHAYGILSMKIVEAKGETFKMIQCRNPWGMSEWRGDWSDNDLMWTDYPEVKDALNAKFENDGTFWIEWKDFKEQYNQVFLCYDFPDTWSHLLFVGAWDPASATSGSGGCPKYPTFPSNPQYTFTLTEKTTLVLNLSREDYRWRRGNAVYDSAVGFVIMARAAERVPVFSPAKMKAMAPAFVKATFVALELSLDAGDYAIIPCTFDVGKEVESFMLEVHSSSPVAFVQKGLAIADIDAGLKDPHAVAAVAQAAAPSAGPFVPVKEIKAASLSAAHSLFETPKEKATEPEEEGRGLKILHTLVGDLAAEMKSLTSELSSLEKRLAALEAARRK